MLDMHAVTGTGSFAALTKLGTILPGGDKATVAGVPIDPKATLAMWGAKVLSSADITGIAQLQMQAQGDQVDTVNAETFNIGGNSLTLRLKKYTNLPYSKGARDISIFQAGDTTATAQLGFTIDHIEGGKAVALKKVAPKIAVVSLAAPTGNSTPAAWNSYPIANGGTTTWQAALPNGQWAILGAWVNNIALDGLLRFSHADFGAYQPGFDVFNEFDGNNAFVTMHADELDIEQGYQFVKMSKDLEKPCCPQFTVSNAGTGLTAQFASLTAEKPVITLNLSKVS